MREPTRLTDERIAMQQHERRLAEALDQRLQMPGIGARKIEIRVAEPAMELRGQRRAGRLVRLERGDDEVVDALELEPCAVGGDRLQPGEAVLARGRDLPPNRIDAACFCNALDPQNRSRFAAGELAELLPLDASPRPRKAVVDEQQLRAGRAQELRRVLRGIGL